MASATSSMIDAAEPVLFVTMIPTEQIAPNAYNPNRMSEEG
jgi:hypothetical protein